MSRIKTYYVKRTDLKEFCRLMGTVPDSLGSDWYQCFCDSSGSFSGQVLYPRCGPPNYVELLDDFSTIYYNPKNTKNHIILKRVGKNKSFIRRVMGYLKKL